MLNNLLTSIGWIRLVWFDNGTYNSPFWAIFFPLKQIYDRPVISSGSRTSQTEGAKPKVDHQPIILVIFSRKLHEIEKKMDLALHLDPPMVIVDRYQKFSWSVMCLWIFISLQLWINSNISKVRHQEQGGLLCSCQTLCNGFEPPHI